MTYPAMRYVMALDMPSEANKIGTTPANVRCTYGIQVSVFRTRKSGLGIMPCCIWVLRRLGPGGWHHELNPRTCLWCWP